MKIWPPDKTTAKVWIISYLVLSISCDIVSGHLSPLRDLLIAVFIGAILILVGLPA